MIFPAVASRIDTHLDRQPGTEEQTRLEGRRKVARLRRAGARRQEASRLMNERADLVRCAGGRAQLCEGSLVPGTGHDRLLPRAFDRAAVSMHASDSVTWWISRCDEPLSR